ncbi:MAG: GNAT family N-acetyltransferase [Paracoccus sp. (in: a-proteobacteria)]|nr:GNAT family N-acetyltransferase [Paracoccus sp. (in: a-proteobacteria)]
MPDTRIIPYTEAHREAVLDLAIAAWTPVFAGMRAEVPVFVYDAFYPDGWQRRQREDVGALLDQGEARFWLLMKDRDVIGFVGLQLHPQDQMGEIGIIAILPRFQGKGLGKRLILFAEARIREAGMSMSMIETVGDSGHAPARAAYESSGYISWPVARYFKKLE